MISQRELYDKQRESRRAALETKPLTRIMVQGGFIPARVIGKQTLGDETVRVIQVDGAAVRNLLDTDFCQGSHWKIKSYIPKNEIWLENLPDQADRCAILAHELHEVVLMIKGESYEQAHKAANQKEKELRQGRVCVDPGSYLYNVKLK